MYTVTFNLDNKQSIETQTEMESQVIGVLLGVRRAHDNSPVTGTLSWKARNRTVMIPFSRIVHVSCEPPVELPL